MDETAPPLLRDNDALFLDFDGTLVDLAAQPAAIRVSPWVVPTLAALQLGLRGALAIVSGRAIDQVDSYLRPLQCWMAGAHGLQLRGPAGHEEVACGSPPERVVLAARDLVSQHPGLLLETKPGGIALHYRLRPDLAATCRQELEAAMAASLGWATGWVLMPGHCVLELKLQAVSKGAALQRLLVQSPFACRHPVFVGDDNTDEHGIEAAQLAGGYGVRVGPGVSLARFRLESPAAVEQWLVASACQLAAGHGGEPPHA